MGEKCTHWQGKKKERGRPSVIEGGLFRGEKNRATETAMETRRGTWATVSPRHTLDRGMAAVPLLKWLALVKEPP